MTLQSLLVSSDERTVRVLRNVLDELEIGVEHCPDPSQAGRKLAQQSFEAVIIDCHDQRDYSLLLGVRSRQQNRRSMTVAIIDARSDLHAAFEKGANFVVYKPISTEKAKSSFRAARALMQRERRRSARVTINIPAYFRFENGDGEQGAISGLSEGGISVRFSSARRKKAGVIGFCFNLPDTTAVIEATGMIAWQDSRWRAGIQFATVSESSRRALKDWVRERCGDKHDPPIACTLIALTPAATFLRTQSPFPVQTRVEILLRAADCSLRTQGKVRFMDPELGMGIEFQSHTAEHRSHVEDLLARIHANPETLAEALVEPEGLDWKNVAANAADVDHDQPGEDTLLRLLRQASTMPRPQFLEALERQKVISESENSASTFITQRNEPRISVSREVEIRIDDSPALEEMHTTAMIDLSHHGARIERPGFQLIPGDPVHLVSGDNEARFRVIWVGEPGSPQEGQIGLQKIEE